MHLLYLRPAFARRLAQLKPPVTHSQLASHVQFSTSRQVRTQNQVYAS